MREDLKGRPLSFTEIAKLVGENWQSLTPTEKDPYEQQAHAAKEKYTVELSEYRKTESYRTYSEYLMEFKAKQLQLQESNQEGMVTSRTGLRGPKLTMTALNENSKRPKLENLNTGSTNTTKSCAASSLSREASLDSRTRVQSLGPMPMPGPWLPPSEPALQAPPPPSTKAQSPAGPSTALPGYRDTVINPNLQTLAWRDHTRPPDLPIHGFNRQVEPKLNQPGILNGPETPSPFSQAFYIHPRTSLSSISAFSPFSPPSLTSDSTVSTQQSTSSSTAADPRQSTYFAPRIPLDPSRERPSFPMHPVLHGSNSKPQAHFDTQLPPIRHPSLSPQLPVSISYNSQSGESLRFATFCPETNPRQASSPWTIHPSTKLASAAPTSLPPAHFTDHSPSRYSYATRVTRPHPTTITRRSTPSPPCSARVRL